MREPPVYLMVANVENFLERNGKRQIFFVAGRFSFIQVIEFWILGAVKVFR
jgi:hypothetical protein